MLKDKKTEEGVGFSEIIAATKGQIVSGVKFMLDYGKSLVLWLRFPQTDFQVSALKVFLNLHSHY